MKRRDFLNISLGGVAATALPLPRLAAASASVSHNKYIWAVAMAKAQNRVSVDLLKTQLKIGGAEASALMGRLASRGVITVPDAAGIARATSPVFYGPGMASGTVTKAAIKEVSTKAEKAMRATLETDLSEIEPPVSPSTDDPVPPEASDEAHSTE